MNWNNLFNPDNAFFSTVRKLLYLVELSILWTVCCAPVITIGPATAALYYAVVKAVRRERSYPVAEFMSAFKGNFRQGAILTAVLLLVGGLSGTADYLILLPSVNPERAADYLLMGLFIVKIYVFSGVLIHSFPLMSRFKNTLIKTIENALLLTVRHLFSTVVVLMLFLAAALLVKAESLLLAVVPGAWCLLSSFVLERVYRRYYTSEELEVNEGTEDRWYSENAESTGREFHVVVKRIKDKE